MSVLTPLGLVVRVGAGAGCVVVGVGCVVVFEPPPDLDRVPTETLGVPEGRGTALALGPGRGATWRTALGVPDRGRWAGLALNRLGRLPNPRFDGV